MAPTEAIVSTGSRMLVIYKSTENVPESTGFTATYEGNVCVSSFTHTEDKGFLTLLFGVPVKDLVYHWRLRLRTTCRLNIPCVSGILFGGWRLANVC